MISPRDPVFSQRFAPIAQLPAVVPRRMVGINVLSVAFDGTTIPLLKQLGITRVRVTLYWTLWGGPSSPGGIAYLAMIDQLRAAGIDVLVVSHAQGWETLLPVYTLAQAATAFAAFLAARAAERPGLTWEVMNEIDASTYFGPWFHGGDVGYTQAQRGDLYGQFLAPVYDAVKAADPTAKVVTAGIIAGDDVGFFTGLNARAPGKFDAFCTHTYGGPLCAPGFADKSVALRAVVGAIPIWVTEYGNLQVSESDQAADLGLVWADNDRNNRFNRNYLYVLQAGDGYAVARGDGSLRQAGALLPGRTAP
jgi:hypothetical protein